ncbi:RHS repeat-associated core domain-containing protein, partial [Burkholderia glumae]
NGARTVYGWDGDTLAYESADEHSTHYLYEPETFVPMAQYAGAPVNGIETPAASSADRYTPEDDPLQRVPAAAAAAHLVFYHCDQIGTPLMMTDEAGELVWEASYRAWGEAQEVIERASAAAGIDVVRNPLRFQGQHVDDETGLHYNRYRYYDPQVGRFINKDPIGLAGGPNNYQYAPNPLGWIDPLGLARCRCNCEQVLADMRANGRAYGPKSETPADGHHIIQHASVPEGTVGYSYGGAPAVQLEGPSTRVGSEHYAATTVQRQAGGGTYAAERRIGYKAIRRAGLSSQEARCLITKHVDPYFEKLGFTGDSPMRTVKNRR